MQIWSFGDYWNRSFEPWSMRKVWQAVGDEARQSGLTNKTNVLGTVSKTLFDNNTVKSSLRQNYQQGSALLAQAGKGDYFSYSNVLGMKPQDVVAIRSQSGSALEALGKVLSPTRVEANARRVLLSGEGAGKSLSQSYLSNTVLKQNVRDVTKFLQQGDVVAGALQGVALYHLGDCIAKSASTAYDNAKKEGDSTLGAVWEGLKAGVSTLVKKGLAWELSTVGFNVGRAALLCFAPGLAAAGMVGTIITSVAGVATGAIVSAGIQKGLESILPTPTPLATQPIPAQAPRGPIAHQGIARSPNPFAQA